GAPIWPPSPQRSARPGEAVARLSSPHLRRSMTWGPRYGPKPPTFGPPRRSRGAPPITAPPPIDDMGAPIWPPSPQRSARPGQAVARLSSPHLRHHSGRADLLDRAAQPAIRRARLAQELRREVVGADDAIHRKQRERLL